MHHNRFSNEMVHQAYDEWKISEQKHAAKSAMMGNLKKGFMEFINKQKREMEEKAQ